MAGKVYWAERIVKQNNAYYDKTLEAQRKQLSKYYKNSIEQTKNEIGNLYDKLLKEAEDGDLKVSDLYKYNRYFEMTNNLNKRLNRLGEQEIKIDSKSFLSMYKSVKNYIGNELKDKTHNDGFTLNKSADTILKTAWCKDGMNFSERIWSNKANLQQAIEKGLVDCVARGVSKDTLVKEISNKFNVDFNCADRICRTELAHTMNLAAVDGYKEAKIEKVQTIVAEDERLCDECGSIDGKIWDIEEAVDGVAYNLHPGCRCTIVPVIE